MNIIQYITKIYHQIILTKKLIWFFINIVTLVPPFKQIKILINKLGTKINQIQTTINQLAKSDIPFSYLFSVYKQASLIFILLILLAIHIYFKFFKYKNIKNIKNKPNNLKYKLNRDLDQLSEKTIKPKSILNKDQQKQEVDSCCQELHHNLNTNFTNQDKVFLQILERYQRISFENQEETPIQQEISKNQNKRTHDNSSIQEINIKKSLQNMPKSHPPKKNIDLNRSSVL